MLDRAWTATVGAAVVLVGSFLPWLASGSRSRSSYDLLGIVDRLGFSPDGPVGWAVRLWPLLPLLLVATVVSHHAHHLHHERAAPAWIGPVRLVITAVSAVYAGAVAAAVQLAPDVALFDVRWGSWVTLAGAALLAASVVRSLAHRPHEGSRRVEG